MSDRLLGVNIDGYFLPAQQSGDPVLLIMSGTNDRFLPVFSTREKLDELCLEYNVRYDRIKQLSDGRAFIASLSDNTHLPYRLRVIVDAYKHANGRIRFIEIFMQDEAN